MKKLARGLSPDLGLLRSRVIRSIYSTLFSPNSLHSWSTAWNTLTEKSTRISRTWRSGNWTRRVLCIGVNCSLASAWTPYWSSVVRVRFSQLFFSGHQRAWSDQSSAISVNKKAVTKSGWIKITEYKFILDDNGDIYQMKTTIIQDIEG